MATTTIQVSQEVAHRLAELKPAGATYDDVLSLLVSGKSRDDVERELRERQAFYVFSAEDDRAMDRGDLSPRLLSELHRRAKQPRVPGEEVTRRNRLPP